MDAKLQRLIDNARAEMGPEVFRQFQDDLAGRHQPRIRTMTCAICQGSGVDCMSAKRGGKCEGCDGYGRF